MEIAFEILFVSTIEIYVSGIYLPYWGDIKENRCIDEAGIEASACARKFSLRLRLQQGHYFGIQDGRHHGLWFCGPTKKIVHLSRHADE